MAKATEAIASNGGLAFSIPNLKKTKQINFSKLKSFLALSRAWPGVVCHTTGISLSRYQDIFVLSLK
jgi:hypothetical protein